MPNLTVERIAAALNARLEGDGTLMVRRLAEPGEAGAEDLAVAMNPAYLDTLRSGKARAAVLAEGADWQALGLTAAIFVTRPRLAMAGLTAFIDRDRHRPATGIHPTAVIAEDAEIGADAMIGPYAVIESGVRIGAGSFVGPHVWVGAGAEIAQAAWLAKGTAIAPGTRIGARLVTHPNVSIGGDGFSFVTAEKSAVEEVRETLGDSHAHDPQSWIKIHSLGGVEIGDDVEIGSNSSVDAGTIRATRIGDGTKIDALVQVGHNAVIGRNCLLCAHVAVGGSAVVGDNSVLGGQVGVADNVTLGAGVIAGGATKILSNVPAGRALLGYPAMKMDAHVETYKALRRLPRLMARVAGLEKTVNEGKKSK